MSIKQKMKVVVTIQTTQKAFCSLCVPQNSHLPPARTVTIYYCSSEFRCLTGKRRTLTDRKLTDTQLYTDGNNDVDTILVESAAAETSR